MAQGLMFGEVLRTWRRVKDCGLRQVAKDIGISAATLSRVERGEYMEVRTLILILNWLMADTPK